MIERIVAQRIAVRRVEVNGHAVVALCLAEEAAQVLQEHGVVVHERRVLLFAPRRLERHNVHFLARVVVVPNNFQEERKRRQRAAIVRLARKRALKVALGAVKLLHRRKKERKVAKRESRRILINEAQEFARLQLLRGARGPLNQVNGRRRVRALVAVVVVRVAVVVVVVGRVARVLAVVRVAVVRVVARVVANTFRAATLFTAATLIVRIGVAVRVGAGKKGK